MIYLLDTNAVIAVMKGDEDLLALLKRHRPQDFAVSAIVVHELHYGAEKSQRRVENLARIEALLFPVLEFDREDARHAGEIRATLATLGTPIGPYDALIGGQARARNLTLMTRNIREFERIKALSIETW
ncbi:MULTISPECIES: type II toxin-antitoxin system VapC family toxin [unclassified Mesorhizobium]|uniref:type II toxin-antitoxin system VapC family toxin n=1 Tax=unclassified Mesorhizobium TaxID=325217 RepID=UPI00112723C0|nr:MULTISPECIES: type II toxin-antitoxin system VapC family toxin [unclassified Mesorhizobium]TPI54416.1 type II toxin-antitoxin system VapC family toxin [Mesorhizobium sp. B3-1-1]TPJ70050.1 type II toxin-antitoxin system VapC family toxin [Mesorhizobium sp. B2-6-7]TPJ84357.1 type II toxin-antitoxin system VapC family toxin [Mesorhizobium sp. B2-6-3]TPK01786.1 type II toxin-antitoxin system VapC family toxin [Mesorhizobium sp. B2-5-10]TPK08659.1 type II toxin-antitoxin system VapC family toxin